jgi:general secretion pathway protein M
MKPQAWRQSLQQRWSGLQARERLGVQGAAVAVVLFLLWTSALEPALKTLRQAPARHQQLDAQMQRMQALRAQAEALRAQPAAVSGAWRQELDDSVRLLGSAELVWSGNSARLRLKGCAPQALGLWLSELGPRWQLRLDQASLQLDDQGLWRGQLTVLRP